MNTTIVIDMSVFVHQLHNMMGEHLTSDHFLGIAKAQLLWLQSGEWLSAYKPDHFQTVLVCDSKPYWRTEYLKRSDVVCAVPRKTKKDKEKVNELRDGLATIQALQPITEMTGKQIADEEVLYKRVQELTEELAIHYKAGRKFPEYTFTKLKKHLMDISRSKGWNILEYDHYEADDIAAAIVKINRGLPDSQRNRIILATVDTDWLGLLDDDTSWFCTHGWYPRVRDRGGFDHWSHKKFGVTFDKPREIWDYKAQHGDKSDNLPPGSPLEVIDLHQPPSGFRLWDKPEVTSTISDMLTYPQYNTLHDVTKAKTYLKNLGVPLAVRPYDEEIDHVPILAA